jgi:hypothetical protein
MLTDFIAIATSLAGLTTIITVIPGLVFGIIYWLFAWLIVGRAADSEGALVRANSTTESSSSASAWTAWFHNDGVPVIKLSTSSVEAATDALFNN